MGKLLDKLRAGSARAYERMRIQVGQQDLRWRRDGYIEEGEGDLENGLKKIGRDDVWLKINNCHPKNKCQSIWCDTCRSNAVDAYRNSVYKHFYDTHFQNDFKSYDCFESATPYKKNKAAKKHDLNEKYIFATGHAAMCEPSLKAVRQVIKTDRHRIKRIRERKASKNLWLSYVYEIELVNDKFLRMSIKSEDKRKQVTQLLKHAVSEGRLREDNNLYFYVHWHGITNFTGEQLKEALGEIYWQNGARFHKTDKCGLYLTRFHKGKHFFDNAKTLTAYPFKKTKRFQHGFGGSDYSEGEVMTDREIATLVSVYQDVQGRSWRSLFGGIGS